MGSLCHCPCPIANIQLHLFRSLAISPHSPPWPLANHPSQLATGKFFRPHFLVQSYPVLGSGRFYRRNRRSRTSLYRPSKPTKGPRSHTDYIPVLHAGPFPLRLPSRTLPIPSDRDLGCRNYPRLDEGVVGQYLVPAVRPLVQRFFKHLADVDLDLLVLCGINFFSTISRLRRGLSGERRNLSALFSFCLSFSSDGP